MIMAHGHLQLGGELPERFAWGMFEEVGEVVDRFDDDFGPVGIMGEVCAGCAAAEYQDGVEAELQIFLPSRPGQVIHQRFERVGELLDGYVVEEVGGDDRVGT